MKRNKTGEESTNNMNELGISGEFDSKRRSGELRHSSALGAAGRGKSAAWLFGAARSILCQALHPRGPLGVLRAFAAFDPSDRYQRREQALLHCHGIRRGNYLLRAAVAVAL